jgi:hypothetical protein
MKEAQIVKNIRKMLTDIGAWHMKVLGGPRGRAGIPDIIGCHRGKFFALEVKRPETRNKTTPHQKREIMLINAAGGVSCVVTSVDEARAALSDIMED